MCKLALLTVSALLGVAGVGHSVTAEAHSHVTIVIDLPRLGIIEPFAYVPGYYAPYHIRYCRSWHRDFDRDRPEQVHRRWDRR